MRVLITFGSKRGGTEGIAQVLAQSLRDKNFEVEVRRAGKVGRNARFDAAIIGGALYANQWHADARRFVNRHEAQLRTVPVWFFSSGPLDDSADRGQIAPTTEVQLLMERVGAQGHMTFGGRLAPDARGFPASAMARTRAGDWRNPEHIRAWASSIAPAMHTARPGVPVIRPARSLSRLAMHALVGWSACGAIMGTLLRITSQSTALTLHAIAAPLIFLVIAWHYFRAHGAREPLPTALAFTGTVASLDLVIIAGLLLRSFAMFTSIVGTWLPFALIFGVTWATGAVLSMIPATPADSAAAMHRGRSVAH